MKVKIRNYLSRYKYNLNQEFILKRYIPMVVKPAEIGMKIVAIIDCRNLSNIKKLSGIDQKLKNSLFKILA